MTALDHSSERDCRCKQTFSSNVCISTRRMPRMYCRHPGCSGFRSQLVHAGQTGKTVISEPSALAAEYVAPARREAESATADGSGEGDAKTPLLDGKQQTLRLVTNDTEDAHIAAHETVECSTALTDILPGETEIWPTRSEIMPHPGACMTEIEPDGMTEAATAGGDKAEVQSAERWVEALCNKNPDLASLPAVSSEPPLMDLKQGQPDQNNQLSAAHCQGSGSAAMQSTEKPEQAAVIRSAPSAVLQGLAALPEPAHQAGAEHSMRRAWGGTELCELQEQNFIKETAAATAAPLALVMGSHMGNPANPLIGAAARTELGSCPITTPAHGPHRILIAQEEIGSEAARAQCMPGSSPAEKAEADWKADVTHVASEDDCEVKPEPVSTPFGVMNKPTGGKVGFVDLTLEDGSQPPVNTPGGYKTPAAAEVISLASASSQDVPKPGAYAINETPAAVSTGNTKSHSIEEASVRLGPLEFDPANFMVTDKRQPAMRYTPAEEVDSGYAATGAGSTQPQDKSSMPETNSAALGDSEVEGPENAAAQAYGKAPTKKEAKIGSNGNIASGEQLLPHDAAMQDQLNNVLECTTEQDEAVSAASDHAVSDLSNRNISKARGPVGHRVDAHKARHRKLCEQLQATAVEEGTPPVHTRSAPAGGMKPIIRERGPLDPRTDIFKAGHLKDSRKKVKLCSMKWLVEYTSQEKASTVAAQGNAHWKLNIKPPDTESYKPPSEPFYQSSDESHRERKRAQGKRKRTAKTAGVRGDRGFRRLRKIKKPCNAEGIATPQMEVPGRPCQDKSAKGGQITAIAGLEQGSRMQIQHNAEDKFADEGNQGEATKTAACPEAPCNEHRIQPRTGSAALDPAVDAAQRMQQQIHEEKGPASFAAEMLRGADFVNPILSSMQAGEGPMPVSLQPNTQIEQCTSKDASSAGVAGLSPDRLQAQDAAHHEGQEAAVQDALHSARLSDEQQRKTIITPPMAEETPHIAVQQERDDQNLLDEEQLTKEVIELEPEPRYISSEAEQPAQMGSPAGQEPPHQPKPPQAIVEQRLSPGGAARSAVAGTDGIPKEGKTLLTARKSTAPLPAVPRSAKPKRLQKSASEVAPVAEPASSDVEDFVDEDDIPLGMLFGLSGPGVSLGQRVFHASMTSKQGQISTAAAIDTAETVPMQGSSPISKKLLKLKRKLTNAGRRQAQPRVGTMTQPATQQRNRIGIFTAPVREQRGIPAAAAGDIPIRQAPLWDGEGPPRRASSTLEPLIPHPRHKIIILDEDESLQLCKSKANGRSIDSP